MTDSVRNLIMDHVCIFQPDNNLNINLKNNTKMGHWAQNQASATIPVLWPEPCRKWVKRREEKKYRHGAVNLKDLEWFWMKEWSLIFCQVFYNLIGHFRRTFRAIKLLKLVKLCVNCSQCVLEKNIYFIMISPPPFLILIMQWKVRCFYF